MFEWNAYLLAIFLFGCLFFAGAVGALVWAVKNGQFKNIDGGATVIFDEEEPEGVQQDFFPGEAAKQRAAFAASEKEST
ncbi:cbb3-type cytochrome oxidase assembly protein [Rubellicoccus peritrichatus]|uniref:Cbb3-type cytochrome oxidase assembly protein CcoS n=1 Tax=Rubellicoccus peritrichatus TaxID=3080537 RepID=A0AAQ3QYB7_9BACT|nr:cbb3-type cytochrome oxidase assembly protein CcoS [Puniceicoccus sp. CR14]WOO43650.1 cbb3-type cytochrome oxidase assembly protein CcoS [Puniceicoccus sp. CR14]